MPFLLLRFGDVSVASNGLEKRHVVKLQPDQLKVMAANPLDLIRPGLPVLNDQGNDHPGRRQRRDDRRRETVRRADAKSWSVRPRDHAT